MRPPSSCCYSARSTGRVGRERTRVVWTILATALAVYAANGGCCDGGDSSTRLTPENGERLRKGLSPSDGASLV